MYIDDNFTVRRCEFDGMEWSAVLLVRLGLSCPCGTSLAKILYKVTRTFEP